MPETNEPTRVPATIEQLESLKGATPEFVVAQLKAKATLPESTNALNAMLFDQLENAKKQTTAPQPPPAPQLPTQPLAAPQQSATQPNPQQPQQGGSFGAPPVSSNQVAANQGKDSDKPWAPNPIAFYRDEMRRLKNSGMSGMQAAAEMDRRHPGLRDALQAV